MKPSLFTLYAERDIQRAPTADEIAAVTAALEYTTGPGHKVTIAGMRAALERYSVIISTRKA